MNSYSFWVDKFKHACLPIPKTKFSPNAYKLIYANTNRIMKYVDYTLTHPNIHVEFEDLFMFQDYLDEKEFEQVFMEMQVLLENYFKDVQQGYDELVPYAYLYISQTEDKYKLSFRRHYDIEICSCLVDKNDIKNILYQLFATYHYPYDDTTNTIILFNI